MAGIPLESMQRPQAAPPAPTPAPAATPKPSPEGSAPAPAAPPEPAPVAPTPEEIELTFRGEKVPVTLERARQLAQMGLSSEALDQRKADFERERSEHQRLVEAGQILANLAQHDKQSFQAIQAILSGQVDPGSILGGEDDLTDDGGAPTVDRRTERELAALRQQIQQIGGTLQQRDFQAQVNEVVDSDAYLKSNPEAAGMARSQIAAMVQSGEASTPQQAVAVVSGRIKRLVQGHLEAERRQREANLETSPGETGIQSVVLDPTKLGYASAKSGVMKAHLLEKLRSIARGVSGPTGT